MTRRRNPQHSAARDVPDYRLTIKKEVFIKRIP